MQMLEITHVFWKIYLVFEIAHYVLEEMSRVWNYSRGEVTCSEW